RLDRYGYSRQRIGAAHDEFAALLRDLGNPPAIILGAVLLDRAAHEFVVALAARANVHVENVRLAVVHLVFVKHGVLRGVHAANLAAIRQAFGVVARSDTTDKDDALGNGAIVRAFEHAACRPRRGYQPLKLQRVNYVFVLSVAILAIASERRFGLRLRNAVKLVAGGHHHGADGFLDEPIFILEIDRPGLAFLLA